MRKWRLDRIDSYICPQCAGLFVDLDQKSAPALSHSNINPGERKRITADGENPVLSPSTGKPMVPFLYRGVEVDYCEESNAVWFDPGEIERAELKPKPTQGSPVSHRTERGPFEGLREGAGVGYYFDLGIVEGFIGGLFDTF